MDITEHGHWDGQTFVFDHPLELAPGKVLERLDTSEMRLPAGLTIETVIEGLLDPHRKVDVVRDE